MAGQPPPVPNSTFFVEELERALKECGFGILSWEVEPSDGQVGATVAQAEAKVELLPENNEAETGRSIRIKLSIQGYQTGATQTRYYETLDDLLSSASPQFEQRRTKLLFAKLEEVAASRSWEDYAENANGRSD